MSRDCIPEVCLENSFEGSLMRSGLVYDKERERREEKERGEREERRERR